MPARKRPAKEYTATEVGVLVEGLRSEIRAVAEGQTSLRTDMDDVKDMLGRLMGEVSGIRTDLTTFNKRLLTVEAKVTAA